MKFDISQRLPEVDALLLKTTNPRHRAILENYKRHATLEVTGYWEEIFDPRMTVSHPVYRFHKPDGLVILDGAEAVKSMYKNMANSDSTVIYHTDGQIAVGDDGFFTEYKSHKFVRGHFLQAQGNKSVSADARYITTQTLTMHWPYDEKCRLLEERVFYCNDLQVRECPPDEWISVEEAREKLLPTLIPIESFLPETI